MAEDSERSITIERTALHKFRATNVRGGTLLFGDGDGADFSPVELFLASIVGCTALDIEYIAGKRATPTKFGARIRADKVRDEAGNHLTDIVIRFDVEFPSGPDGDAAREVLPSALQRSHDRLCTVARTVERGTPVAAHFLELPS
jgi:putative redox protein